MEAVVVAHPDDETLWCGGWIARFKPDVICCTVPRRDPERAIRFFDAVRELGGYPILIPFVEPEPNELIQHLDALDLSRYSSILTHGEDGEYGHLHHKQVNAYVKEHADCPVVTFGGDYEIVLTESEQERKRTALECYDHRSPSDCGKPKWVALLDRYNISMDRERYSAER
jgi:LmbE family N-acetylglucosaminyl deacetylase